MHLIFDIRGHYLNWDSMNTIKMNCFPEVRHLTSWAKERFFYLFSYMHEENKKKNKLSWVFKVFGFKPWPFKDSFAMQGTWLTLNTSWLKLNTYSREHIYLKVWEFLKLKCGFKSVRIIRKLRAIFSFSLNVVLNFL